MNEQDQLARRRFTILTAIRAIGVAAMLLGMGIFASGMIEPREIVGVAIFLIGAVNSLIVPRLLLRKWRSAPKQ